MTKRHKHYVLLKKLEECLQISLKSFLMHRDKEAYVINYEEACVY